MDNSKVAVVSTVNGTIGIYSPEYGFKKDWAKKGQKIMIDKELLENLMYDNGVEYMFQTGMLYIEDMEVKKEMGLEPEDATEPVNIIVLSDKDMRRYLTVMPVAEFKQKIATLSTEQKKNLVDFAVENEIMNIEKSEILKEATSLDSIKMIELNRQNKEV